MTINKIKCPICGEEIEITPNNLALKHSWQTEGHEVIYWWELDSENPCAGAYAQSVASSWNGKNVPFIDKRYNIPDKTKDTDERYIEMTEDEGDTLCCVIYCPTEVKDIVLCAGCGKPILYKDAWPCDKLTLESLTDDEIGIYGDDVSHLCVECTFTHAK